MKTLKNLFLFMAVLGLLVSCSKSDHFWGDDPLGNTEKGGPNASVMVTVPLKADFTVWLNSVVPGACEHYNYQLTMVGEGNISHLGKMTTTMVFCADGGTVGPYGDGTGTFVAANGDELYFDLDYGIIVWNEGDDNAFYPTRFNDEVLFTGGTGRFEGASGSFMTNAFVHIPPDPTDPDDPWHTDFFSTGTLILVKR